VTSHARRPAAAAALCAALLTAGCSVLAPPPAAPARLPAAPRRPGPACTSPPPASAPAPAGPGSLLPFTASQLHAAAALASRFAAAYATRAPGQAPAAWLARLTPAATSQLAGVLKQAALTPAAWQGTPQGQAVTAGSQIRDLTPASVTFTVGLRLTGPGGQPDGSTALAVTVTASGGGWVVYDIEPAAAGNS
jgi:hypothetical protein